MHEGERAFVSRGGLKLDHALAQFKVNVHNAICADLGSNTGGFVDCLLQRGASKVYAIDTGYGVLDWKLRKDPRVVVMERTNAMHIEPPEKVQIVTIDVAWTKQRIILPAAMRMLAPDGAVVTLIKPHYEAEPSQLRKGILMQQHLPAALEKVKSEISDLKFEILGWTQSPILGSKGNTEFLAHLKASSLK